jgi:hypothetical protein
LDFWFENKPSGNPGFRLNGGIEISDTAWHRRRRLRKKVNSLKADDRVFVQGRVLKLLRNSRY